VLLVGDPNKPGVFIARLKFPPNYQIPPHTHPFAEVVVVLSGKLGNGMGEKFDAEKGEVLKAGASFSLPAHHAHYVWTTDEETIVELIATGPWGITYTDPKEDPRKQGQ
jgi:quercetin dioxygenase-like cupin family protein